MTKTIVHKIEWSNAFSFGPNNVVLSSEYPVTQIVAPNGFGKSSIPLVFEECIFNKNSKNVNKADIPNRLINSGYSIKVTFEADGSIYTVEVDRGSTIKVTFTKDGVDISSHTSTNTFKSIQEVIGLDFKTCQQLMNQSTTNSLQFIVSTDTARKKFLLDLFDLSEYSVLFETFKEAVKVLSVKVTSASARIDTINTWISKNSISETDLLAVPRLPEAIDYSEELASIQSKITNIATTNTRINANNSIKVKIDTLVLPEKPDILDETSTSEFNKELGSLESNKNILESTIVKLSKLNDTCPTCLQPIDANFYNNLLNTNKEELSKVELEISTINNQIRSIESNNAVIKRYKVAKANLDKLIDSYDDTLPTDIVNPDSLEIELNSIKKLMLDQSKKMEAIRANILQAEKHNSRVTTFLEQNESLNSELEVLKIELDNNIAILKRLEVLKKSFSTTGLLTYELENLVKELETYSNEYLAELSDGRFSMLFSLTGDKLDLNLFDDGKEISALSPSSGEMARINIATLLAIRKMMAGISKNTINLLFLDEVISVLDDYGKDRLVEVLLEEEDLNTFLVSHSWSHPLVNKLIIKKENNISRIEHDQ